MIDEMKNLLADFRTLATKLNEDNKNKKKTLKETKQIWEACKKEYQKWFYEHEALKKIQWVRTKKSWNTKGNKETEKKKILCCQRVWQLWIR